jgi:hypothetical protein
MFAVFEFDGAVRGNGFTNSHTRTKTREAAVELKCDGLAPECCVCSLPPCPHVLLLQFAECEQLPGTT